MNWSEFADNHWHQVLSTTIFSGIITILVATTNIIWIPELANYPVYFFMIQTIGFGIFFLFLWFQPKEVKTV